MKVVIVLLLAGATAGFGLGINARVTHKTFSSVPETLPGVPLPPCCKVQ